MAGRAEPPPIPRVKVHATPGEHPLLEFSHPLLGLIGLGVWFIFVGTHHAPLAWVAFGILVAAIAAGLSWLARNARAARRGERPARAGFPPRLVLLHGLAASATFVVAVLTALTASHALSRRAAGRGSWPRDAGSGPQPQAGRLRPEQGQHQCHDGYPGHRDADHQQAARVGPAPGPARQPAGRPARPGSSGPGPRTRRPAPASG